MEAVIISVGDELITGRCVDTNSAWLSEKLTGRGLAVVRHITVGDDVEQIKTAVESAFVGSRLVVITGGLGPTPDDVTRYAVAEAISSPLEQDEEALGRIRAMFERWQRSMHDSNMSQAMIPRGCTVIPNPRGTAPGFRFSRGDARLVVLPGVPGEMRTMFSAVEKELLPNAAGRGRSRAAILRCFGVSEAKIGEMLADLMARGRNPSVGTAASEGIIDIHITARADEESQAVRLVNEDAKEVRARLGRGVFGGGSDTLQTAVAKLLVNQGRTVATAESCTGGMLAGRLTDVPGSSAYFLRGYVTYANEAKIEALGVSADLFEANGAVSEAVALAMAAGCREVAGSDIALSITGIAGPGGGNPPEKPIGLVHLALADHGEVIARRVLLGDHLERGEVRDRACKSALNLLRLHLLESAAG